MPENSIAWDMRFGLPTTKYLKYVSHTLLSGTKLENVDPFTLDIPDSKIDTAYLYRG